MQQHLSSSAYTLSELLVLTIPFSFLFGGWCKSVNVIICVLLTCAYRPFQNCFHLLFDCMYCWIISWLYHFSLPCISCAVNPWWWLHIVTLVCDIELTFCSYQENSFNSAGMVEYCIRMNGWLEKSYTESMKNDRHWAETSDKRSSFSSPLCDVNTLCSLFCFLLAF